MRYAAIDKDGRATGAIYDIRTELIVAHHANFAETLQPVADLVNVGTDDAPVWEIVHPDIADIRAEMVVSRFQARAALRQAGLLDQVDTMIAASGDDLMIDAWGSAVEFRRMSQMIVAMGAALDLDDDDMDSLFIAAAAISV